MSTTTQADNIVATLPLAIFAIAQHMVDRGLPAPYAIDSPNPCMGETTVIVRVSPDALPAWVDTLAVDSDDVEESSAAGWVRAVYVARLPESGVRLTVKCLRPVRSLAVVVNR